MPVWSPWWKSSVSVSLLPILVRPQTLIITNMAFSVPLSNRVCSYSRTS